jgi:hypothetical protein
VVQLKTIKLSNGDEVIVARPNAGQRNNAAMLAETADGIKMTKLKVELLPLCVKLVNKAGVKVREYLDSLSTDDWDSLWFALEELMDGTELKKKSSGQSESSTIPNLEVISQ